MKSYISGEIVFIFYYDLMKNILQVLLVFLLVVAGGVVLYLVFFLNTSVEAPGIEEENLNVNIENVGWSDETSLNSSNTTIPTFEEDYYAGLADFFGDNDENYYENIQGEYGFIQW